MKNKDDIRTFVVVLVVCMICLIIGFVMNIKTNIDMLQPLDEYNVFFANVSFIDNYINAISNNDSNVVFSLLDTKYISDNNITRSNVSEKIENYSGEVAIHVDSMEFLQFDNNFIYYVKGKIYESGKQLIDDNFSIIVITDYDNLTYSLYPVDDNNYKKVINGIRKVNVDENDYNKIGSMELINKEQICVMYLSDFIHRIANNSLSSYDLLSEEMKKTYTNSDSYVDFISNNIDLFSTTADMCKVEDIDDKRVYTVIDENENMYIFYEDSIMNYKVDFYMKEVTE